MFTTLQNKTIKSIREAKFSESATLYYYRFKSLKLLDLHRHKVAKFVYANFNKKLPQTFLIFYFNKAGLETKY